VKSGDVEVIAWCDAALDLEIRRDRFPFLREVLVNSEVIVDAPPTRRPLEHVTLNHWLLDQALHGADIFAYLSDMR
jgi:hypothetical protein